MQAKVTLVGTWMRENTLPSDITMLHHMLRRFGPERGIQGDFHTYREPVLSDVPARHGTFKVVVFVHGRPNRRDSILITRAKTILDWFLSDHTCRRPVVDVDRERSTVTWGPFD